MSAKKKVAKKKVAKKKVAKKKTASRKKKFDDYDETSATANHPAKSTTLTNPTMEFFKFENVGDSTEGIFIEVRPNEKTNYQDTIIFDVGNGKLIGLTQSKNLKDIFELPSNKIKAGDYLYVTFTEVVAIGTSKTFKKFTVSRK